MEVKISKWGNSMALRLPKSIVNDLNISEGTILNVISKENKLVAEPVKKKYSLKELLNNINDSNIHSETDTGMSVGNEI